MEENRDEQKKHSEYDIENSVEIDNETRLNEEAEANSADAKSIRQRAGKGGFQKELESLKAELEKAAADRDAMTDRYQRTFSDFNNYKKRNEASSYQAMKAGEAETIEKMLPVLDSMEKAIEHVNPEDENPLSKGIHMVYKQLTDILEALGVKEIDAMGKEFDPNLHHAIQQVDAEEGGDPGTVAAVARKGYMINDRVLRPSMVIVNK